MPLLVLLILLLLLLLEARPASRDADESEFERLALTAAKENEAPLVLADCEAMVADSRPALAPETPNEFAAVCADGRRLRTRVKEDDVELLLPSADESPAPALAPLPLPVPPPPPPPIERTVSIEERYPSPSELDAPLFAELLPRADMPEPKRDDGRNGIMPLPAPPAPPPAAPMVGRMIDPLVMASREPVPDAGPMLRLSVLMLPRPPEPPAAAPFGRPVGGRSEPPMKAGGAVAPRLRGVRHA